MTITDVLHRWRRSSSSLPHPRLLRHQVDQQGPVATFVLAYDDVEWTQRDHINTGVYVVVCEDCRFEVGELSSSDRYDVMEEHLRERHIQGPG